MMNKYLLIAAFAGVAYAAPELPSTTLPVTPTDAPQPQPESGDYEIEDVPNWVNALSNLPPEARGRYISSFEAAKRAFARGSLSMCEQCLDECEAIFSGNPNVWNLRASVLIALKRFADAEGWLKKVREVAPDDVVATLNFSLLYLGSSRYEDALAECDSLLISIKYKKGMDGLRHSLMFRKFLCLVMLDKVDEAKQLVADVTPMTHSPLYYYTQSVLAVIAQDRNTAIREMTAADSIYRTDPYLATYKQGITFSGILERFLPSEPQSAQ
ncbi:MAG: hypothetical protein IJA63_05025 [Akkermansia sp.]|nr:hypothetical protein [Akkermansia sp.]